MKRLATYFELQSPDNARWLSMEGFRGFAVLLVFFVHYTSMMTPLFEGGGDGIAWLTAVHEMGNAGVDLFFVLSGFLIYRSVITRPLTVKAYSWRRFERIYPTFLVILAIYLALSFAIPSQSKLPASGQEIAVYLVQNALLLPGIFDIVPIVHVAWSLSFEVFYYIAIPIIVGICAMRRWLPGQRLVFFIAVYGLISVLHLYDVVWNYRLTMFFGGIILYEIAPKRIFEPKPSRSAMWDILALMGLVTALAAFTLLGRSRFVLESTPLSDIPSFVKFIFLNASLVCLLYRSLFLVGIISKMFSFTPLRWLGNMSYSYYLMHSLGLHFFFKAFAAVWPSFEATTGWYLALIPGAFLATLVSSAVLYLVCERPLSLRS